MSVCMDGRQIGHGTSEGETAQLWREACGCANGRCKAVMRKIMHESVRERERDSMRQPIFYIQIYRVCDAYVDSVCSK